MRTIVIVMFVIMLTADAKTQWLQQTSGTPSSINDIWMLSVDNVIACGTSGTILRTTSGGNNWSPVTSGTASDLVSIFFLNTTTGWISGASVILKTVNGGETWTKISFSTGTGNIYFTSENTGWRATNNNIISKTTNSGSNWQFINLPASNLSKDVHFVNAATGYSFSIKQAADSSFIYKSTNAGNNWNLLYSVKRIFTEMSVVDESNIFLCGTSGRFLKTNDGGQTWRDSLAGNSPLYQDVKFINALTGYMCGGSGSIFATFDGGIQWQLQSPGVIFILNCISFLSGNSQTGFIGGTGGTILKTINGGLIGINQIGTEVPKDYLLSQNYPNPFNPSTNIKFSIPKEGNVKLTVSDVTGKQEAELVNSRLPEGTYNYDFNASHLSSGVYFYRLQTGDFTEVKKMVLIK
jgi:photosystem II stability/assembly factor-like uncharacterized protein